ncbi:MAG TPA: Dabb family protein, partial [Devosiaceae bacterium]|nr:Dabb family protein [Devosiaceae bacterium]
FDTAAARDAYLVHPDHQAVGARIVAAAEGGPAGILVFDFELPG